MRRAAKVDRNQAEIVQALRDIGARVKTTHMIGGGFPDLVVEYRRTVWLLEVKDGTKSPSRRRLTPDEERFHALWDCAVVVKSVDEAIMLLTSYDGPADVPPF